MIVKVKYSELDEVKKKMLSDKDLLKLEIERLLKATDKLHSIWLGEASDSYYNNAYPYIKRMEVLVNSIDTIEQFIDGSSKQYKENDKKYSDKLKQEVQKDESRKRDIDN